MKRSFTIVLLTTLLTGAAIAHSIGRDNAVCREKAIHTLSYAAISSRLITPLDSPIKKPEGRKINLSTEAKLTASHTTTEWTIKNAIDGNHETQWIGEGHPLTWQPTNIIIEFDEPKVIQQVVLLSTKHRDMLALKDFEIYAWGKKTWAGSKPLAIVKHSSDEMRVINFPAVKTKSLRIRIRDTYYYHSFPRLKEIEVYEALPGAEATEIEDAPIADENKTERLILDRAFGKVMTFPRTKFKTSKGYLHYAKSFADTMIASGTDRYGKVKSPMFASIIDMATHRNPLDAPENSPGQRFGDRSIHGGNLFHDVMFLQAMDNLTKFTRNDKYQEATTAYLTFFLKNCPQPATGLFPWGEHAYWNFYDERPSNEIHEFLGGVPNSFWERMWAINPKAVEAEASGRRDSSPATQACGGKISHRPSNGCQTRRGYRHLW